MPRINQSRYSAQKSSEIRCNIINALQELATFTGIDIKKMQSTPPYSMVLNGITSQKISSELKKLIDSGMVLKESAKGKTVKYMLKTIYDDLFALGKIEAKYGFGDYRDTQKHEPVKEVLTESQISKMTCDRIAKYPKKYDDMW